VLVNQCHIFFICVRALVLWKANAILYMIYMADVIGPVFQPDCRLAAVTLPQGGINDEKKNMTQEQLLRL
jgi:hypothetical protein